MTHTTNAQRDRQRELLCSRARCSPKDPSAERPHAKVSTPSGVAPARVSFLSYPHARGARRSTVRFMPAAAIVALLSRGVLSRRAPCGKAARESLESESRRVCACFFSLSPTCAWCETLTCACNASSSDFCSALARGALQKSPWLEGIDWGAVTR